MARTLDALRDTRREWMINRSRLIASMLAITIVLGVLVYRYYSLQIVQHDDFMTQSDRNRIRLGHKVIVLDNLQGVVTIDQHTQHNRDR